MKENLKPHKPLETLDFRQKLERALKEKCPELLERTYQQIEARGKRIVAIDEIINDEEISEIISRYGLENIFIRELPGKIFELENKFTLKSNPLPEGYAYKGGAARALLLRALKQDNSYLPRDFDVVRVKEIRDNDEKDREISSEFMPEDFLHGHGVEVIESQAGYFQTRDLTINEVLAMGDKILVTKACILDTIRKIIRPTPFEKNMFGGSLGPKMLAKTLRFYSENIARYGEGVLEDIPDWEYEEYFVSPFWVALNLDRAVERGNDVAQIYVAEMIKRKQLPENIKTVDEACDYLVGLMVGDFYFRYAPSSQYETEEQLLEDPEEQLLEEEEKEGLEIEDLLSRKEIRNKKNQGLNRMEE